MEYDYTNNYVFVSACENTVAADQTPKESVGLKLYPNPSTETIKVSVNTNQLATIQIYNSLGMEVYSAKTNGAKKSKIDISNLVDGLYILQVKLEDGREIAGKFMKLTL